MIWARMLAYITGTVDQELLLRNEYLAAENRILRAKIKGRLLLSESEKATLAEIARRLGRKALADVAAAAKPDTLLRWYRKLIAKKFDGSRSRKSVGRPPVDDGIESLVVRMARENPSWGYDRIKGAMANLGYKLSDQTVGNILKEHDIPPASKRKKTTSWKDFIRAHMAVMVGTDFFTVEVLTLKGLKTYYVLLFLHLESRRICLAGVTRHPDQDWMEQMARNVTMEETGILANCRYLLHDRDSKYCASFCELIGAEKVTLALPPKSPNLNAFAERWVRSVKEECLSKLILFGERSLKWALHHYEMHYHQERNHQGKDNLLLFSQPTQQSSRRHQKLRCRQRLGGLLKYYEREAA
jgi:putative transposase